ncbi:MAG TPA: DUF6734 family protein [Steroidobacteraceae bacterium]
MRAVWSFWSKPFLAFKGRIWREPVHHLLAWGLSLRAARKHYPETVLVTDYAGAELLVGRLGLEFAHVCTDLECLRTADVGWWALGKLLAYSLQDRPFVHIDTDVFLWKPLPPSVANAAVFAQCPEDHSVDEWCGPRDIEAAFAKHSLTLPAEWEWARSRSTDGFREDNCGILGGTRVDFIRYYAQMALDLVRAPAHAAAWAELPQKASYNMMIEQFWLAACLDYHRFHPNSPYQGIRVKHLFPTFAQAFDPRAAARVGYTHLMGDAKGNAAVVERLERRVQQEDREFYRHCMQLTRTVAATAARG